MTPDPERDVHESFDEETPSELLGVRDALDRLGRAERAAVPAGLTDRIASRVSMAEAPAPILFRVPGRLRLAAAIAVVTGGGVLVAGWMLSNRTVVVSPAVTASATQATPVIAESIEAEEIRSGLEDLFASYDAIEESDLADSAPVASGFWDDEALVTKEDPIQ